MIRPSPRSNSRMSARGGSRASDEDGKTSVKVGTLRVPFAKKTASANTISYSRPRSTAFALTRPWLRAYSAEISKVYGPCHLAHELSH